MPMEPRSVSPGQDANAKASFFRGLSQPSGLKPPTASEGSKSLGLQKRSQPRNGTGFVIMDSSLSPISFNSEAVEILDYPNKLATPARSEALHSKIRSALLSKQSSSHVPFVSEFKSGRRRYFCRAFLVDSVRKQVPCASVAVLLERGPSGAISLPQLTQQYHFTQREAEAVVYVLQGLSSKEIANRMNVSTNTIKTFLRLIMIKTGVSSRSAMIGKIMMTQM